MIWVAILTILFMIMLVAAFIIGFYTDLKRWRDSKNARRNREKALELLLEWAIECDFGYDSIPDEYERYKHEIRDMEYTEGLIYIAEKEMQRGDE